MTIRIEAVVSFCPLIFLDLVPTIEANWRGFVQSFSVSLFFVDQVAWRLLFLSPFFLHLAVYYIHDLPIYL